MFEQRCQFRAGLGSVPALPASVSDPSQPSARTRFESQTEQGSPLQIYC